MRPPHCAGEIPGDAPRSKPPCASSFNEAPALRGGNPSISSLWARVSASFNEAPALRGGNPPRPIHAGEPLWDPLQ